MDEIAKTPRPPYYAVVFTSQRTETDDGYADTAQKMLVLASQQNGFLGVESAREKNGLGITVSYWQDLEAIKAWKNQIDHRQAQRLGKEKWYKSYRIRIAKVEREYGF